LVRITCHHLNFKKYSDWKESFRRIHINHLRKISKHAKHHCRSFKDI
jgi:hypothetical protein